VSSYHVSAQNSG